MREDVVMTLTHEDVQANGITVHTVSVGEGPLVLFCHGFPESWYSWRHQLDVVADAGFRAVAMDMRGYGGTTAPEQIDAYSMSIWSATPSAWSLPSAPSRRSSWATTGGRRSPGTAR